MSDQDEKQSGKPAGTTDAIDENRLILSYTLPLF